MLAYDYSESIAVLEDRPRGEIPPHLYLLCERCADGLRPPLGWTLLDRRDLFHEELPAPAEIEDPVAAGVPGGHDQRLLFGESA